MIIAFPYQHLSAGSNMLVAMPLSRRHDQFAPPISNNEANPLKVASCSNFGNRIRKRNIKLE